MEDFSITQYRNSVKPVVECPYVLTTESMAEMSYGVVWEGVISLEGRKVGAVEDKGDGGGTWPTFSNREDRLAWESWLRVAYPHIEGDASEEAIAHLMFIEDEAAGF
jgi:hypothetical protein